MEYLIQDTTLTRIADAIRGKTGKSDPIQTSGMAAEIQSIQAGGVGDEQLDGLISDTLITLNSNATSIAEYGIYRRATLETVNFPELTLINGNGLASCEALKTVNAPMLERLSNYALTRCTALEEITLPSANYLGTNAFAYCAALKKVDVGPNTATIRGAFSKCSAFDTFIVRAVSPPTLDSAAFNETPIASGTGLIYVPRDSVETYKQATNWTLYAEQIRAIEDHPDITGGAV